MCMGGGSSQPKNNMYNGQVRNYAGGYGSVTTDTNSDGKPESEKYFDETGKTVKKSDIDTKRRRLTNTTDKTGLQIPT
jgi:hypothetical protein